MLLFNVWEGTAGIVSRGRSRKFESIRHALAELILSIFLFRLTAFVSSSDAKDAFGPRCEDRGLAGIWTIE